MKIEPSIVLPALVASVALGAAPALAQDYPSDTVRIIVPYPPGGSADLIGRMLADQLSQSMDEAVIVENHGGASGAIGAQLASQADADGHTLLIGIADTHAINPAVNANLPYDPVEDFEAVSLLARQPIALAVSSDVEAETLQEFVDAAKAESGSMFYATNGVGGMQHLAMASFSSLAGFEAEHVPFPGSGPAMADVAGGHVDAIFISMQGGAANFEAGTIRPLAIAAEERLDNAPDLPTFAEAGYTDFGVEQWYGLFAPAGTPDEVVATLNEFVVDAMQNPEVKDPLAGAGTQAIGSSPEEFEAFLSEQIEQWGAIAAENEITVEQ